MATHLKSSKNRDAVLEVLKGTKTHPSADWIFEKVKEVNPNIGIATVYRNLKTLLEQKEIFKVDVGDGLDHYDAQIDVKHDHTYCTACGAIGDIDAISTSSLKEFAKNKFSAESYSLVLFGKCEKCQRGN